MNWKDILKQNPNTESGPETAGQVGERDSAYGKVYNQNGKTFYEAGTRSGVNRPPVELTQDLINQIHSDQGGTLSQIVGSSEPSKLLDRLLVGKGLMTLE